MISRSSCFIKTRRRSRPATYVCKKRFAKKIDTIDSCELQEAFTIKGQGSYGAVSRQTHLRRDLGTLREKAIGSEECPHKRPSPAQCSILLDLEGLLTIGESGLEACSLQTRFQSIKVIRDVFEPRD